MNKLNFEEILEILKNNISIEDFAYHDKSILSTLNLGEIEEVSQYGGMGKGEMWYSVKYFKDHDIYIKVDGFYSSYECESYALFEDWDECVFEVRPESKTITVYE